MYRHKLVHCTKRASSLRFAILDLLQCSESWLQITNRLVQCTKKARTGLCQFISTYHILCSDDSVLTLGCEVLSLDFRDDRQKCLGLNISAISGPIWMIDGSN